MEWMREWIMKIAATILLSILCDMIVPKGEMKKYVNVVTGLLLIVMFIGPIANASFDSFEEFEHIETRQRAIELQNSLSEKEQIEVIRLYKKKISQKMEESVRKLKITQKIEFKPEIEDKNDEKFGNINAVSVLIYENINEKDSNRIKEKISEDFDVKYEEIRIIMLIKQEKQL